MDLDAIERLTHGRMTTSWPTWEEWATQAIPALRAMLARVRALEQETAALREARDWQVAAMRRALTDYGQHAPDCAHVVWGEGKPCDCGLARLRGERA